MSVSKVTDISGLRLAHQLDVPAKGGSISFAESLQKEYEKGSVQFSKHAMQRMQTRGVDDAGAFKQPEPGGRQGADEGFQGRGGHQRQKRVHRERPEQYRDYDDERVGNEGKHIYKHR